MVRSILSDASVAIVFMVAWIKFWTWIVQVFWEAFGEEYADFLTFPE